MSTATAPLTVEQFRQLPEERISQCELVDGEIVPMASPNPKSERVKCNVTRELVVYNHQSPVGLVVPGSRFALAETEDRIPDVSFVLPHRLGPENLDKLPEGAPELAIEVVSSETAATLEHKVNLYLRTGSRAVWVFYPDERTVWAHRADGTSRHLREGQHLEEPDLLPGFRVPATKFFEGS